MNAQKLVLIALTLVMLACGKEDGKCASDYSGDWNSSTTDGELSLTSACVFNFQSTQLSCQSQGTYAAPLGDSGSVAIEIKSTSGSGCLPVGSYTCSYDATDSALNINCGAGTATYTR